MIVPAVRRWYAISHHHDTSPWIDEPAPPPPHSVPGPSKHGLPSRGGIARATGGKEGGGRKHAWQNIIAYILVSILSVAADPSTGHQLSASFTFSHTCSHHHIPHTTISTILSLSLSVTLTRANRLLPGFRVISTNLVARAMAFEPRMNVQNINNFLDSFFWTERISNGNTK